MFVIQQNAIKCFWRIKITMKSIINFSLLISLQVCCHQFPEYPDHDHVHKDINSNKHQDLPLAEEEKYPNYHKIVSSNAEFAFRFYQQIASDAAVKNIFFSPFSISIAFALLTLGAKSETRDQIHKALAFNLSDIEEREIHEGFQQLIYVLSHPRNKVQVNIGNALFIEESLKFLPKFLEDAKTLYEAEGFSANFSVPRLVKKQINDYVRNKTHGKIAHAVEDLEPTIVMVLVNYMFFKASWKKPFNTHFIRKEDFFIDANTTVQVDLMRRTDYYNIFHDEDLSCWVVEIPYEGDATALFILPDEGKLEHVEAALVRETLSKWRTSFTYKNINLQIPKFSMSTSYNIKGLLRRMGVTAVFDNTSDLSGITGKRDLKVSEAFHKTLLNIHESGTEAAAVTIIEFMLRSAPAHVSHSIRFNRSFLMICIDKQTEIITFLGRIMNPTEE
ncbi:alpha-1-antitrypsin-like isoform X2 [Python bivittatus]|uniref:Alpha-1-antitrypsin-like isoform X2 n=1 Tax=Python bivittatus TaxID=176946 RepID=A0A9F5J2U9_PYTBI|nr:alpha-1-antitrypsin-like isoform X2 [Python bivittatus]